MQIQIEVKGPPGCGKTTALRLIRAALSDQFDIKTGSEIGLVSENEHYVQLECVLRRPK